jgi:single-strand DNA-binding protein
VCADYLHKGSQVMVSGSMHNRKWTDKNGAERYSTEIRVNTLQMLGAREGQQETRAPTSQRSAPGARRVAAPSSGGSGFDDMDDDIPF